MESTVVVTIDGPAGTGKSTVAKKLAKQFGFHYLDTGAMYRALTLYCLQAGVRLNDSSQLEETLQKVDLQLQNLPEKMVVLLNGQDVSEAIRTPEVSRQVQYIAKNPKAREFLWRLQRDFARGKQVIAEGRDMGTIVFPEALVKFYLDASLEERARRRQQELARMGCAVSLEEVLREIQDREHEDTHRDLAPLRPAEGAVRIDTTHLSLEEVVEHLAQILREKLQLPQENSVQK